MAPLSLKRVIRSNQDKIAFAINSSSTKLAYSLGKFFFPKSKRKARMSLDRLNVVSFSNTNEAETFGLTLPTDYVSMVGRIYDDALERMSDPRNCLLRSADDAVSKKLSSNKVLGKTTWEIPEVKDGLVGTVHLRNTLDLDGLEELAQHILPQVESLIYNSWLVVERANVFRRLPSHLPEFSSILWHSDNHYQGVIKIMIYLNDVGVGQAPFEFLRHKVTHEPIHVEPSMPQLYPRGRVPKEVIDQYIENGYEAFKVVGPQNTMLIFDDKIIHKGNYAESGFRDVLVLQLKPAIRSNPKYIDERFTSAI